MAVQTHWGITYTAQLKVQDVGLTYTHTHTHTLYLVSQYLYVGEKLLNGKVCCSCSSNSLFTNYKKKKTNNTGTMMQPFV